MTDTKVTTRIATSDAATITVRGKDLVDELIGRYSFTEIIYFLITDRFPTAGQTRVLDACLVTLAEHGFTPSALVARLIHDSVPGRGPGRDVGRPAGDRQRVRRHHGGLRQAAARRHRPGRRPRRLLRRPSSARTAPPSAPSRASAIRSTSPTIRARRACSRSPRRPA